MAEQAAKTYKAIRLPDNLWQRLQQIEMATTYRCHAASEFIREGNRERAILTLDELEDHLRHELRLLFKEVTAP
ncbi:MAG TPA: hypothetical protein VLW83_18935 [Candidatus Acidoferrales bacterium]|nr:hypothetical protein [Candidatus Acidoferrales bacterium]